MHTKRSAGTTIAARTTGIPAGYEKTVLRILPCNPFQMFVYWELPPSEASCTRIILSLFEKTPDGGIDTPPVIEQQVSPQAKHCYLTVPTPGLSYCVTLTVTFTDGNTATLQSTTGVHLPSPAQKLHSPIPAVIISPGSGAGTDPAAVSIPSDAPNPSTPTNYSSWTLQERSSS